MAPENSRTSLQHLQSARLDRRRQYLLHYPREWRPLLQRSGNGFIRDPRAVPAIPGGQLLQLRLGFSAEMRFHILSRS
jgi:hypothetical protein